MKQYIYTVPFLITSILADSFLILISLKFEALRNGYPFRFVFILSIINLIWTSSLLFPVYLFNIDFLCSIQGFLNIVFSILDLLWRSYMSFEMYRVKFHHKDQLEYGYTKPFCILLVLGIVIAMVPLLLVLFEFDGAWCWIGKDTSEALYSRLICFYVPTWLCIFVNVFVAVPGAVMTMMSA